MDLRLNRISGESTEMKPRFAVKYLLVYFFIGRIFKQALNSILQYITYGGIN